MAQPMKQLKSELEPLSAKDKADPAYFFSAIEPDEKGMTPA
jgi:hypothetical protein